MPAPLSGKIDLNRQVALVTGAARSIGQATAAALAREGADVIIADILDLSNSEQAVKAMGKSVSNQIAEPVVFMCSQVSNYISGMSLEVCGGL